LGTAKCGHGSKILVKINKDNFRNLSNKERAEVYADVKVHHDIYKTSKFSTPKRIHNLRFQHLTTLMKDVSNKKILDAGCGEGYFLSKIQSKKKSGIELSEKRVSLAKKLYPELNIQVADLKQLPFNDNSFDVIICSEVLEHVSNFKQALKEFKRCIKPDGCIILSFPNEPMVGLGRLIIRRFPIHEVDHINSISPVDIKPIFGEKYVSMNVPPIPYPLCLYQIYRFDAINFK
jgi:2-polyprenyl-3-methyl-5-hydroxy-6-metoxy-1,4-benzoquinol methylase